MTRQQRLEVNSLSIGVELKQHRRAARMTLRQVGDRLGMSPSLLSRLETGRREALVEEVSAILAVVGVHREERERLIDLAKGVTPGLVESTPRTSQSRTYVSLEKRATTITDFEPLVVPGLAQIPEYTRALLSVTHVDDADPEPRVARRMARLDILKGRKPPRLNLIVTEHALRQPIGGARTMAQQIRHLIELAERPNVSVLVVPITVAAHAGLAGPFIILDFADDPTIVFIEDRTTGLFLDDPAKVATYKLTVERLVDVALDAEESTARLASIVSDLESEAGCGPMAQEFLQQHRGRLRGDGL